MSDINDVGISRVIELVLVSDVGTNLVLSCSCRGTCAGGSCEVCLLGVQI